MEFASVYTKYIEKEISFWIKFRFHVVFVMRQNLMGFSFLSILCNVTKNDEIEVHKTVEKFV
jgi:hypothetical protein